MTESDQNEYAILLPGARVAVFSEDEHTLGVAEGLTQDWRFARVEVVPQKGDVKSAIAYSAQYASPDLIIVQTEVIDDEFTAHLEELAGHCDEGTAAIVIGPVNDVYLYRKLVDMGVSDYLVKPMTEDILSKVIAKTLVEKRGVSGSKLISVIGAKGGIGTTAISQALAWGISDMLGQKTALLDVAGGWSSMSVGIGFEPVTTLAEAVAAAARDDQDSIKRMMHKASDKLEVLAHGVDSLFDQSVTAEQVETLLETMLTRTPVVVADLSQSQASFRQALLSRSNFIIVTSSPVLSSLRLARSLIHEMKDLRGGASDSVRLLITMQGMAGAQEVPKKDIAQAMDFEPAGFVPFDPKLFQRMENDAEPLIKDSQGAALVKTILLPLVQNILSADDNALKATSTAQSAGLLGGILGKFSGKR
ncbi:MAG: type II secretion protein ATPase [Alphaproteobacteria bacterium]|nr:type II secretion protein ATPase [Alphaproteobacteria bacterium]MCD8520013.1 type II secretion protein ATPase [Alphaproteobacteria bacterium]MCD8525830.1 type II secretion protein ATPase [Alphaproteobacteria bacterium]MCD8571735.1 type II secretion protein ATPase [Alphaproteobacteria bacterium]